MTTFPSVTWTFYERHGSDWTACAFIVADETEAMEWAADYTDRGKVHRIVRTDFDGSNVTASDVTDALLPWVEDPGDKYHAERLANQMEAAE